MDQRALPNTDHPASKADSEHDQGVIQPPAISLPKGGGAIRGMGEKFAANPVTGTGSMSVPIATSPGRSGFGPQLSLSYDSGSGSSPFGFGWSLSLPAITRKTDKGLPKYQDAEESDVFILSGAEDLVPVLNADGSPHEDSTTDPDHTIHRYRPRIEGLFARIERWTNRSTSEVHWRSISKDNILTLYGKDPESRIADPTDPGRVFSWLICETRDDKGNAVLYEYKREDGTGVDLARPCERNRGALDDPRRTANRYLKGIRYGNRSPLLDENGHRPRFLTEAQIQNAGWMFEVVFDYGEHDANAPTPSDEGDWGFRADPFSTHRAGFEVRTTRLCQRVLMFHHFPGEEGVGADRLVRSTDFDYSYEQDPDSSRNPVYTFLCAVTQNGYRRDGDGYLERSLPPVEFEYTQPLVQSTVEEVDPASLENLPIGTDGSAYRWTDLHGEGIPGVLTEQANTWYYKRNLSPLSDHAVELAPMERVALKPNVALAAGAQFMDLAGDGQPDLVVLDGPTPGLYEHDTEEGWQPFRPFTSRLNRNTRDPNLKLVDLDGDGHADVLITEDDAFVWHASLAEAGFGPARRVTQQLDEEKGPRLVFADGTQSVYLADLSGDGLTDLVRIRNSEVCYWPNLGYGRFGAKVTMDHAPWFDNAEQFDQKRIRLADIDGTGTTDILYLHRDGVRLYFNQSGNGWSEAQTLDVFPRVDSLVSIVPADLLGNGTACLVWSSPLTGDGRQPMRYVNLMGGQKPHLLGAPSTTSAPRPVSNTPHPPSSTCKTSATANPGSPVYRSRSMSSSASRHTTTSAAIASSPATPITTVISTARSASSVASAWWSNGTRRRSAQSQHRESPRMPRAVRLSRKRQGTRLARSRPARYRASGSLHIGLSSTSNPLSTPTAAGITSSRASAAVFPRTISCCSRTPAAMPWEASGTARPKRRSGSPARLISMNPPTYRPCTPRPGSTPAHISTAITSPTTSPVCSTRMTPATTTASPV